MCIYTHHPLIEGMLKQLPEQADPPTEAYLARWLRTFEINLRLIYDLDEATPPRVRAISDPAGVAHDWTRPAPEPFMLTGSASDDLERWHDDGAERDPFARHASAAELAAQAASLAEDLGPIAEMERDRIAADVFPEAESPFTDAERQALTDQALATAREVEAERRASYTGPSVATARHAAEQAARALEAEQYDLEQLEREQVGIPKPAGIPPEIAEPAKLIEYDRAGRYIRKLLCPFPAPGDMRDTCGKQCQGEMGLLGHLSGGHGLRGHAAAVERQRRAYVDAAIAIARGLTVEIDPEPAPDAPVAPEAVDAAPLEYSKAAEANADLEQLERDRKAGRPLPEPAPLNREALSDLIADRPPVVGSATLDLTEALLCPYGPEGHPCAQPVADAIVLDLHLRAVHDLGDDRSRLRVGLVDQALEELDERLEAITTDDADAPGTLEASPAATRSTGT